MNVCDRFRQWMSVNVVPAVFLASYFLTVVLGNITFTLPLRREQLLSLPYTARIFSFDTLFSFGYWLLLLMPFAVTPLIIMLIRRLDNGRLARRTALMPEITRQGFALITTFCSVVVFYSLSEANAFHLFTSGTDAYSSVEARFQILANTGVVPQAILMSVLPFLCIYATIRWFRNAGLFWAGASIISILVVSIFLVLINMKWPVLLFYCSLVLTIFLYARRAAYIKAVVGGVGLVAIYLLMSSFVFRLAGPAAPTDPQLTSQEHSITQESNDSQAERIVAAAIAQRGMLLMAPIDRMAIIYPYYYEVFTKEGAVCGGILEQAQIGPACRPSTFIYTRIFGEDGFEGRGTSPAAVHISGYAIGGWPVALFALLCASVILGLFSCLPLNGGVMAGSLKITGAIVGYHFSQVPGEGPLIYNHGVVWVLIMLFCYMLVNRLWGRVKVSTSNGPAV